MELIELSNEDKILFKNVYSEHKNRVDYSLDLDDVWRWISYTQKIKAKTALCKNFQKDVDYIIVAPYKSDGRGGHNREIIMLKFKTFKSMCMKTEMKKAKLLSVQCKR